VGLFLFPEIPYIPVLNMEYADAIKLHLRSYLIQLQATIFFVVILLPDEACSRIVW